MDPVNALPGFGCGGAGDPDLKGFMAERETPLPAPEGAPSQVTGKRFLEPAFFSDAEPYGSAQRAKKGDQIFLAG
jgi:hypothetical protein